MSLPEFSNWHRNRPLPPGTKIRLHGRITNPTARWWHGLEATILSGPDFADNYITTIFSDGIHHKNMAARYFMDVIE